mgnify:CR=1 FL=1
MAVPELSREERLAALEQAKAARMKRAQVKEQLAAGEISLIEVIAMKDDEAIGKMKVADLIQCIPHYGEAKTKKVMEELKISPNRRLRGLGKRQEIDLVERLGHLA